MIVVLLHCSMLSKCNHNTSRLPSVYSSQSCNLSRTAHCHSDRAMTITVTVILAVAVTITLTSLATICNACRLVYSQHY
jgi:hypothetical protein